jgi:lauroyl/myristoyl acyltransferase
MTCLPIRLFGRQAWFPRGLIRLAVGEKLPVMGFTLGLDRKTGRRILTVRGPLPNHDEQALAQALADLFTEALTQDPVAWHFWPFVQDFLHWDKKSEKPRSAGGSAGC